MSLFVEMAASSVIMVRTGCCYSSSFTSTVSEPQTDAAYFLCIPLIVCVCFLTDDFKPPGGSSGDARNENL